MSLTTSVWPFLIRLSAIGPPILPNPINPIRMMYFLPRPQSRTARAIRPLVLRWRGLRVPLKHQRPACRKEKKIQRRVRCQYRLVTTGFVATGGKRKLFLAADREAVRKGNHHD